MTYNQEIIYGAKCSYTVAVSIEITRMEEPAKDPL